MPELSYDISSLVSLAGKDSLSLGSSRSKKRKSGPRSLSGKLPSIDTTIFQTFSCERAALYIFALCP